MDQPIRGAVFLRTNEFSCLFLYEFLLSQLLTMNQLLLKYKTMINIPNIQVYAH